MLATIREEILRAARETKVELIELEPPKAEKIRCDLLVKYGKDQRFEFCCDNVSNYAAVQHPEAWTWIHEFVGNGPVLLFYDSSLDSKAHPDRSMFLVPSGRALVELLEECYGFVFYVTNDNTDFVLCFNDHDYLIGSGNAKDWTASLAPRYEAWAKSLKDSPSHI
ncbi:MAG: hypothetical protein HUU21_06695 [Polyangiaceae bacterium]|nr:hypothetical protein [Polyangiaceae bacterium]